MDGKIVITANPMDGYWELNVYGARGVCLIVAPDVDHQQLKLRAIWEMAKYDERKIIQGKSKMFCLDRVKPDQIVSYMDACNTARTLKDRRTVRGLKTHYIQKEVLTNTMPLYTALQAMTRLLRKT